jgi:hypothetical protein
VAHKYALSKWTRGKNDDQIVKIDMTNGKIEAVGVLYGAEPGNDYCNGYIAPTQQPKEVACMVDCLHVDDVAIFLDEKGLEKRPEDK